MTVYLGIDYGTKHLGIALADGPLATPITSINLDPMLAIPQIMRIIEDNHVEKIVIGLPEGQADAAVRSFGSKLSDLSTLPVFYHPETLSTHEALSKLRESGAKKSKLMDDHVYAACLILEDYLETVGD